VILKRIACLLGIVGGGALLMLLVQNENERKDLLKGIALWSLTGSGALFLYSSRFFNFLTKYLPPVRKPKP
tara:strand:- start:5873 stop:6085 length:213 start_codon:yes stop_codon:yes gene_type:complete